jgi:hypothetical protein
MPQFDGDSVTCTYHKTTRRIRRYQPGSRRRSRRRTHRSVARWAGGRSGYTNATPCQPPPTQPQIPPLLCSSSGSPLLATASAARGAPPPSAAGGVGHARAGDHGHGDVGAAAAAAAGPVLLLLLLGVARVGRGVHQGGAGRVPTAA